MSLRSLFAFCLFCTPLFAQVEKLSETGLYEDILAKKIKVENRAFSPQYPLWTDGALKRRWIYLPPNTKIKTGVDAGEEPPANPIDAENWQFPVGTKFWKEFSFLKLEEEGYRRIETRLIEKVSEDKWEFSTYVWNEDETDADLAPTSGIQDVYPTGEETKHDIPSLGQCLTCHRGAEPILGFEALQLSDDRDPLAFSEPSVGEQLTLSKLIEEEKLSHVPDTLANSPRIHANTAEGRAAMGYMHGNCAHCHNPNGSASWTQLFFKHTLDVQEPSEEPAFMTSVGKETMFFQIPGQEETFRIKEGKPEQSAILYRINITDFDRMPPVASEVIDQKAVDQITAWINLLGSSGG